jgi:hypothetical protein
LHPLARRPKISRRESREETTADHSRKRTEAEARFKKAKQAKLAAEGSQAMAEYVAAGHAVRAKTARLRELRLAEEAAEKEASGKMRSVVKANNSITKGQNR